MSQNDNKTWTVQILDPQDGSGDAFIPLPDDLLKILDLSIGDTLWAEVSDNKILLKKLKLNKG